MTLRIDNLHLFDDELALFAAVELLNVGKPVPEKPKRVRPLLRDLEIVRTTRTLRAVDFKARLDEVGMRAFCGGTKPTRTGVPRTTLGLYDDASQIVAQEARP